MQNLLHSVGEALTPVLKESNFLQTGRLTPEEYVSAGDYLVFKCPTWSWSGGDPAKRRSFLPKEKQFLITKAVPCTRRVKHMQTVREKQVGEWTDTVPEEASDLIVDYTECDEQATEQLPDIPLDSADDIPDLETFTEEDNVIEFADPSEFTPPCKVDNIMHSRTYDLSITYDKYYQTPRLWLCGYDEQHSVLEPSQVFEDISQEHARKTVTIETHPHLPSLALASIHPCKHAHVMKSIIASMQHQSASNVRVDQYLVLFLKFMGCVLPTIDYDYTMSVK